MTKKLHLDLLKEGVVSWNQWREKNPEIQLDLYKANLSGANLRGVHLSEANLREANLTGADLREANLYMAKLSGANLSAAKLSEADLVGADLFTANLSGADLSMANLNGANLNGANLIKANLNGANLFEVRFRGANLSEAELFSAYLSRADLFEANLNKANLHKANLKGAYLIRTSLIEANFTEVDLTNAILVETDLEKANFAASRIYGISAWNLKLRDANQEDLIITPPDEPTITVDNLEVAQFIYLLLHSDKIRHVIDTITSKLVLILGRFTPERKAVLNAIREELRKHNYLPILFDFEKPANRDMTETVSTLAHLARFVIADITDARSIPQELEHIVPDLPSLPIQPLLQASANEYGMFEHFKRYPWVLKIYRYKDLDDLLQSLGQKVIAPAEAKIAELGKR